VSTLAFALLLALIAAAVMLGIEHYEVVEQRRLIRSMRRTLRSQERLLETYRRRPRPLPEAWNRKRLLVVARDERN
jgi:surfactin synthase thioesterase subunit